MKYYHAVGLIGIATGMQVISFRHTILATLPLTLSPVGFMNEIMGRRDTVEYLHMALRLIQENLDAVDMNLILCKEFRMVDLEMMKA